MDTTEFDPSVPVSLGLLFIVQHGEEFDLDINRLRGWDGDVASLTRCPLATADRQSVGYWATIRRIRKSRDPDNWTLDDEQSWAAEHGFECPNEIDDGAERRVWTQLGDEWRRQLAEYFSDK